MKCLRLISLGGLLVLGSMAALSQTSGYRYIRTGENTDVAVQPRPAYALIGGGTDLDEAFRFLCERSGGGDMLVLRATGDDVYNAYFRGICHLNSVATLIIPSRDAAANPFVAETIKHASAIFIAGGDQADYINFWMNTPMQAAINDAIQRGVPIGGTSAGLAVLGESIYTAQADKPDDPNLDGRTALADPYGPRINLGRGFLQIPPLHNVILDTHFKRRDRMGRLLVFLARLNQADGKPLPPGGSKIRAIGVDERTAILLEPDGRAHVVGEGHVYFIDADRASGIVQAHKPLTFGPFTVQKVSAGSDFYINSWAGDAISYKISVDAGRLKSSQTANEIY